MAYVDEGPKEAPVVLMLHGQPMWGWLYHGFMLRYNAASRQTS